VLFLVWDAARADRMSLYGARRPTTPNLAKYAEHAAVWTEAVSPSFWAVPSHASLFTGLPARTHGCDALNPWLRDARITMAEWFGDHGWSTYAFTANPNIGPRTNLSQGFDQVEDQAGPDATAAPDALFRWIDSRAEKDRPFLAFINMMDAHFPRSPSLEARKAVRLSPREIATGLATPLRFADMKLANHGEKAYTADQTAALLGVYDASLWELDRATRDMLAELERRGLSEHTLVVVVADHGELVGEHGLWGHNSTLYEELVHVPLVLEGPGVVDGRRSEPTSTADVFPTLARLAGIPLADPPGDLFAAPRSPVIAEATAHSPERPRLSAIYDRSWKLIRSSAGEIELYDLSTDAKETKNLASGQPDRVSAMSAALDSWQSSTPLPPSGPLPDAERKRRRDADHDESTDSSAPPGALGYLE
jgi:arylsulfatase A-like enzyme